MKKLLLLLAIFIAATASAAALPPLEPSAPVSTKMTGKTHKTKTKRAPLQKAAVHKSPEAEPMNPHRWVDMGTGRFTDDILTTDIFFDGIEVSTFDVRVQEDEANPGVYRIVDPWANYPHTALIEEQESELTRGDDICIIFDARDPEFVRLLRSPFGLYDEWSGQSEVIGYSEAYGIDDDILEEQLESHGTLTDGVIRFTEVSSIGIIVADEDEEDGDYIYNTNDHGATALYLPGVAEEIDYDITTYTVETFCPDENDKFHVRLGGDERIPALSWILLDNLSEESVTRILTEGTPAAVGDIVEVNMNRNTKRVVYLLVASLDADGYIQKLVYAELTHPEARADEWIPIGTGRMTEGFLSCLSLAPFSSETFDVEVEENKYLKGYYRLKDPYKAWSQTAPYDQGHGHSHYLYINAYNPDEVYVEYSILGLDVSVFGELAVSSDYAALVSEHGYDILNEYGIHSGGKLENNVITFNNRNDIRVLCHKLGQWYYTNRLVNPDYDEEAAADAGDYYDVEPYIAGPFKLDISGTTAINELPAEGDSVEAAYFNLQGRRIARPEKGIVIEQRDNKARKVIL